MTRELAAPQVRTTIRNKKVGFDHASHVKAVKDYNKRLAVLQAARRKGQGSCGLESAKLLVLQQRSKVAREVADIAAKIAEEAEGTDTEK